MILYMDVEDIQIRLYFGNTVNKTSLTDLMRGYWPRRNKETSFTGTIKSISELSVFDVLKNHLQWREQPNVRDHYLIESPFTSEYNN